MLGNFSFGDYFKEEAITWAWEYVTEVIKLPADQLWITVHPEDHEAREIWINKAGVSPDRLLDDEENFWAAGPVGPCGPCSEIYVDLGEARGCGKPDCAIGCDCDRFLEIWNLVFMQYTRDESGTLTPLPRQNIDTGMGLERITSVMQGVVSNFDTDLFIPIINKIAEIAGINYKDDPKKDTALKVISDHTRAIAFMLGDGIRPSSDGRGYVLRRILRRAVRYARLIGIEKPFLEQIFAVIQSKYAHAYPELKENENFILNHLKLEEKNFQATLEQGTQILQDKVESLKKQGLQEINGTDAFHLYETYGFPVELTEEILAEEGITVDMENYQLAFEEHRKAAKEQSRQMVSSAENMALINKARELGKTEFVGYRQLSTETFVAALFSGEEEVASAGEGEEVLCLLPRTPFYAESGGQVADKGWIRSERAEAQVMEVRKLPDGSFCHRLRITSGVLKVQDTVVAEVDGEIRKSIAAHHSSTHLLHTALRKVLGQHVQQAGSLVSEERLRFDFSHFSAMSTEELNTVEEEINRQIRGALSVNIAEMCMEDAKAQGAIALFGEKYGDEVRVVRMGEFSTELCGGTHVQNTGEIGIVKILSESGIGAGLRRIEAVAGKQALAYIHSLEESLEEIAVILKAAPGESLKKAGQMAGQLKDAEREIEKLNARLSKYEAENILDKVQEIQGVKVLAAKVQAPDMDALRKMSDTLKDRLKEGVIILGASAEGKVHFVSVVSPSGLNGLHAGKIIKEVAAFTGGSGGGRPDMAQAGGKDPSKIEEALAKVPAIIKGMLG